MQLHCSLSAALEAGELVFVSVWQRPPFRPGTVPTADVRTGEKEAVDS